MDASTMPPSEDRPRLYRCRQIQRPQKGRKANIVGLARAPTPYSAPKIAQPCQPGHSCNSKASRNRQASTSGVNVVSQIQRTDQYQTYGQSAHDAADHTAMRSPKVLCAIQKMGMQVSVVNRLLMLSNIHAEA